MIKKTKNLINTLKRSILLFGLFFGFNWALVAQNVQTVTGTIVDDNGLSVIGASIVVKGDESRGTITDFDGHFSINSPSNGTLLISYVGYQSQEIKLIGQKHLNITLKEDAQVLDELVVVGYGVMKKSDLTGAVSSVGAKSIEDKAVADIGQALQGRAAGVQIVNSGSPGSNVVMRIRGMGTINAADPLIVIDGVPTDLNLNAINQNDIETVDILKDASATAIYGSRGANGVVMITTKKGKPGDGQVSVSANFGIQQRTSMPKVLNASQFASMHNEMMSNAGRAQNPAFSNPLALGKGTDWMDAMFRSATFQNYSIAYSGGGEKNSYYVSGGVFDQNGIVINTSFRRFTFQFNGESKVKEWLKFGNAVTLSHDVKRSGAYGIRDVMAALPTQPIYNEDGTFSGPGDRAEWWGDMRNPIGSAKLNKSNTKGYNLLGNIYGELDLLKKVKVKSTVGIDAKFWDNDGFTPKYDWKPIPVPSSERSQSSNKSLTYLWDNTATYIDTFNDKHSLNVMIGSSAQNNVFNYINASVKEFLSDDYKELNNGLKNPLVGGAKSEWALLSFLGRVNYSYDNKYLVTATIRRDGTSRISKSNRWGTFPSFSAAWRVSEEDFYPTNDWVNDIKVRVGYGVTGNQSPLDNYAHITRLATGRYVFNENEVSTLYPLVMPSPSIKWETVKQGNIGIDIALLQQRVNLTFDAYIKNTTDMLVGMAVPITSGYSDGAVPQVNAGKMQNKGWELTISSQNLTGELNWSTDVNVSFNKNKIKRLNEGVPMYYTSINMANAQVHMEGQPGGSFYGYVTDGIFQNWEEVNKHAYQQQGNDPYNSTSPGDIRFKDLNNDGVINDADRTFIGNPTPEWTFSMNNMFKYKDFDFEFFLQGVAGNDILNGSRIWQEGMSVVQNQTTKVLDRWTGEGSSNSVPRAVFSDPNKNTRISDRWVENGAYLRLKTLTLGYTLPKSIASKMQITNARFYLSGHNLITLTKYSGFDPEVSIGGVDLGTYPVTRNFSVGVNLSF